MTSDHPFSHMHSVVTSGETEKLSTLTFTGLSYSVKVKGQADKKLIDDVSVSVRAGELLAIMGPSGAGKSTLLDCMSARKAFEQGGTVSLNGTPLKPSSIQAISSFVEQEDALMGVLTVRETIAFSLQLFLPTLARRLVDERVDRVIDLLGLQSCAETRIGTPISRGISGGQKRRVSLATSIVCFPRVMFCDEVTSGLDSTAAREVMTAVRRVAISEGIIVLATIHQPSFETLSQFTSTLLLAGGRTCYCGPTSELEPFLKRLGVEVPKNVNPSDMAMDILNDDFASPATTTTADALRTFYMATVQPTQALAQQDHRDSEHDHLLDARALAAEQRAQEGKAGPAASLVLNTWVLMERLALNYSRNLLAFGIRAGMYAGMGLMIATIWIRLGMDASIINDRLSIHFFAVAFLAFMSVAGIPGFLEERAVFKKERANGIYGEFAFILSNSLVTMPFLFACAVLFSVIMYWGVGLHPGAAAFFRFLGFLYLALLCAEAQVQLVAALVPIFVASLAIAAFMNGFWMSVGGYFIKYRSLPHFWRVSFHWMDYQTYAFQLLVNSDLNGLVFNCGQTACPYPSSSPGAVSGEDVLRYLEIHGTSYGKWTGILIGITFLYRLGLFAALKLVRKW